MSFKEVGTLIFIAICFVYGDCAPKYCIPLVKEAVLHSYSTSGTICKREAPIYDFDEPLRQKRIAPTFKTLDDMEESTDWIDQLFTDNEIEEMLLVADRVIRAGISRNEIISFAGNCCKNLEICRMNPKSYIQC